MGDSLGYPASRSPQSDLSRIHSLALPVFHARRASMQMTVTPEAGASGSGCRWRRLVVVGMAFATLMVAGCSCTRDDAKQRRARRSVERIEVSVVGVHDGDTLTGLTSGREQIKVRLEGIDAPELGQPFGRVAKRALSDKVFGKTVEIVTSRRDLYGRVVGQAIIGGRDVGEELVREGSAWHATNFSHDKRLAAAEARARRARAGLWADRSPEPPWEFRKQREKKRDEPEKPGPGGWFWGWLGW